MTVVQPAIEAAMNAALEWYEAHGRDLAFRRTSDPWAVLASEVMAQQTQAARAAEAWVTFIDRFPTPAALAAATDADVIRAWRGLGYNRRAVALRAAAVRIVEEHAGAVPDDLEALQALPGVGPYTARAVLAIAFGRPVAALDTNIRRVLDRCVGTMPANPAAMQLAADSLVPADRPAAWTHALMDVGATICRKRHPSCDRCPLRPHCAFARGERDESPLAVPRAKRKPRFETTTRWLRGRILDQLRDADDGSWIELAGPIGTHAGEAVQAAVAALARERLVELDGANGTRARLVS